MSGDYGDAFGPHDYAPSSMCGTCGAGAAQHDRSYSLDHEPAYDGDDGWECLVCGAQRFTDLAEMPDPAEHGIPADHDFATFCDTCKLWEHDPNWPTPMSPEQEAAWRAAQKRLADQARLWGYWAEADPAKRFHPTTKLPH